MLRTSRGGPQASLADLPIGYHVAESLSRAKPLAKTVEPGAEGGRIGAEMACKEISHQRAEK